MNPAGRVRQATRPGPPTVIVSGLSSDAHTWNLVFLELLLAELGYRVTNLGACVPDELLVRECLDRAPELLVLSSVNGHGHLDGARVVRRLRGLPPLAGLPIVIGGKLGVAGGLTAAQRDELARAGCDAVFEENAETVTAFRRFLDTLPVRAIR
ncbi:methylaspartate mutase [Solwaraspora sp. WMMD937]|uniref:cobalamin B12-binding domain-containing protein n=1 Tax=Solwaraspora sp. WMMD937 TaxID=3016090 RepID=UPI00249A0345|nr:cobalamin-dependent protein [Solwaraspora sp. WMMD937]WFE24541.1 methylaspartate mutase [Solwaraspora sp. WMMD937]